MNSAQNPNTIPSGQRPLGFWLKVIDRKLAVATHEVFTEYGIGRRDWRRLSVIARGIEGSPFAARLAAHPEKVAPLVERGWVQGDPGAWTLTEAGQTAHDELRERISGIKAQVVGSVSAEDLTTTVTTLEAIARGLGYTEGERTARRGLRDRTGHGEHRRHRGHRGHHGAGCGTPQA